MSIPFGLTKISTPLLVFLCIIAKENSWTGLNRIETLVRKGLNFLKVNF